MNSQPLKIRTPALPWLATAALLLTPALGAVGCRSSLSADSEWFRPSKVMLPESETRYTLSNLNEFFAVESHFEGLGPYPLLLDTAGGLLMISHEIEDALLQRQPRETGPLYLDWPGERRPIGRFFRVSEARLGPVTLQDLGVCSTDFGAWKHEIGRAPQGFVGLHLFRDNFVTIDFRTGEMMVRDTAPETLPPPEAEVPFRWLLDTVVEARITVSGEPTWVVVDSGSSLGLQIPPDGSFPIIESWRPWRQVRDLQGTKDYSIAKLDGGVKIGDTSLSNVSVVSHSRYLESPSIGMEVLRHFRMTLDTKNRRLWFEGPDDKHLVVPEPLPQSADDSRDSSEEVDRQGTGFDRRSERASTRTAFPSYTRSEVQAPISPARSFLRQSDKRD